MKDLILDLKAKGKTVVMSSHQLDDVQDVCDRIGILYQGELKELGRVDELLRVEDETQIRCSHLSEAAIDEIKQVIAKHEGELKDVSNPQSTLEQLFLEIVRQSEERPGMRAGSK